MNLKIFTISGEVVTELSQQGLSGMNRLYWNAKNRSGKDVASGIFIYSLEAAGGNDRKKLWGKLAVMK